jgi:KaiC/GvpD/RAD55 family RecA-like ATPase
MSEVRVTQFPIKNLEYVFQPCGLPLALKHKEIGTTSILVRGGAGTGKTTLAVALAHAIASFNKGIAIYLTMEFVPTEVRFKSRLLKLGEEMVLPATEREKATPGALVVHPLSQHIDPENPPETMLDRKNNAIDAIFQIVKSDPPESTHPIRVVVFDAFGLSDDAEKETYLRNDMLNLIQSLEAKGISTVLIQESKGDVDWLSFIVDIVFEAGHQRDATTKELYRTLTCPKSRYALANAGPHDMGIGDGAPEIWPDMLPIVASDESPLKEISNPLSICLPLWNGSNFASFRGGLLLSSYDVDGPKLIELLINTPGIKMMDVYCGPLTKIDSVFFSPPVGLLVGESASALAWVVLQKATQHKLNVVGVQGAAGLFSRPRFRATFLNVIEAWKQLGLMVFIHEHSVEWSHFRAIADIIWPKEMARGPQSFPQQQIRLGVLWLTELSPIPKPPSQNPIDSKEEAYLRQLLPKLIERLTTTPNE